MPKTVYIVTEVLSSFSAYTSIARGILSTIKTEEDEEEGGEKICRDLRKAENISFFFSSLMHSNVAVIRVP